MIEAVRAKVFNIFLERSSILFASDETMLWLKEVIGFALNCIDEGELDPYEFAAKVTSMVENPFYLDRCMHLKSADFTDDITTVNPQELLNGPDMGGDMNQ